MDHSETESPSNPSTQTHSHPSHSQSEKSKDKRKKKRKRYCDPDAQTQKERMTLRADLRAQRHDTLAAKEELLDINSDKYIKTLDHADRLYKQGVCARHLNSF